MTELILREKGAIRVGIVDDHEAVRLGFKTICETNGFQTSCMAATVDELLTTLQAADPAGPTCCDVVVLDLSLSDGSTPKDNVSRLVAAGVKVLLFSIADRKSQVAEALRAGAAALIKKSQSMDELAEAIQLIGSGIEVNNTETSAAIDSDAEFKASASLTPREREVLSLYASGFTMRQVAAQLQVKESTVKEHIDRVRAKYSSAGRPAPDKGHLVVRAIEDGLIDAVQL